MVPDNLVSEQFSGVIDRVQLIDVVQSACLGGEGRDISVESDFGLGTIRVRSGQAVYCKADEGAGENAIKRLLLWPGGYFLSGPGSGESEQNVWRAWEQLLIDSVQYRNEMGYSASPDSGSVFSGKITGISLIDLVQLACMTGVERELRIEAGDLRGTMLFRDGRIFHSECGGLLGEHAFQELMLARSGRFESRPLNGGELDTIDRSLEDLLAFALPELSAAGESGSGEGEISVLQKIQRMRMAEKIRAAMTGSHETRSLLMRENNRMVQLAVIANPRLSESEVALIAGYKHVDDEVLRRIAANREWMRLYQVRAALVRNPKCPIAISIKLVQTLGLLDLRNLAVSRSIPGAVSDTAKRLIKK